jgi:hypothetical protein
MAPGCYRFFLGPSCLHFLQQGDKTGFFLLFNHCLFRTTPTTIQ